MRFYGVLAREDVGGCTFILRHEQGMGGHAVSLKQEQGVGDYAVGLSLQQVRNMHNTRCNNMGSS